MVNGEYFKSLQASPHVHPLLKIGNQFLPAGCDESGNLSGDILCILGIQWCESGGIGSIIGRNPLFGDFSKFLFEEMTSFPLDFKKDVISSISHSMRTDTLHNDRCAG